MATAALPPTLVLGLGNPVLGDDGIGCRVAQALGGAAEDLEAEIDTCEKGGLSLMERMLGYRRVILIDALTTGEGPRGRVTTMQLGDLRNPGAGHVNSGHEASLQTALEMARLLKAVVPEDIWVVAIETERVFDLTEDLTPEVAAALPHAVEAVRRLLAQKTIT